MSLSSILPQVSDLITVQEVGTGADLRSVVVSAEHERPAGVPVTLQPAGQATVEVSIT